MPIERIFTRPLPIAAGDAIDIARQIANGLAPSTVQDRVILKEGVHKLSETIVMREELEVLEDGTGVYRRLPSKERMKMVVEGGLKVISFHMPHDRTLIILRGPGINPDGNIIGVLVYRDDKKIA